MDTSEQPLDPRRRETHPERIEIGGEILLRNDVQAKQLAAANALSIAAIRTARRSSLLAGSSTGPRNATPPSS